MPIARLKVTSRCWAPSCKSRSRRRRAASPASDVRPSRPAPAPAGPDLRLQPGMLQGQARRRRGQADKLRLVLQRLVVDQHCLACPARSAWTARPRTG